MRLSDQELELVSAKGASQDLPEDLSENLETNASQDLPEDLSENLETDALLDFRIGRNASSKITNARTGHFKNFFMC
jgi:hypothetical protein